MINGFRKEMLFFTRGGRFIIILVVLFGLAAMSPLLFGIMRVLIGSMEQMYDEESFASLFGLFTNMTASECTAYTVEYVADYGAIVILFILKAAAGGEQQKRSVIIPQCSGFSAVSYAAPKFIIYPLFTFVTSVLAVFTGALLSLAIFGGALDWSKVLAAAVCAGVFIAFITCVQFCLGICTGRSGLAVVICIVMQMLLPSFLALFRVDRFNPFALTSIAMSMAINSGDGTGAVLTALQSSSTTDVSVLNIAVSIGTAIVIGILLYLITIFGLHAKEVHNEGDDPLL